MAIYMQANELQLLQLAVEYAMFTSALFVLAIKITIFGFDIASNSFVHCMICILF